MSDIYSAPGIVKPHKSKLAQSCVNCCVNFYETEEMGVKHKFIDAVKGLAFVFFMTIYGFASGQEFSNDARGLSFFCIAILIIIAWTEIKKIIIYSFKK